MLKQILQYYKSFVFDKNLLTTIEPSDIILFILSKFTMDFFTMYIKKLLDRDSISYKHKNKDSHLKRLSTGIFDNLIIELGIDEEYELDKMLQVLLLGFYIKIGKYINHRDEFIKLRTSLLRKYLKS